MAAHFPPAAQLHMADHNYFSGGDSGDSEADEADADLDLDADDLHAFARLGHAAAAAAGPSAGLRTVRFQPGRKRRLPADGDDGDDGSSAAAPCTPTSSWSCNERRVFTHWHRWTVDDFVARMTAAKPGDKLKSKDFVMQAEGKEGGVSRKFVFGLRLALGGIVADSGEARYREHVGIMLRNKSSEDCNLRFSACVLSAELAAESAETPAGQPSGAPGGRGGGESHGKLWLNYEDKPGEIKGSHGKWFRKAFKREDLKSREAEISVGGAVTFEVKVEIHCPDRRFRGKRYKVPTLARPNKQSNLSSCLWDEANHCPNEDLSDLTLICDGQRIKCHRLILSARSDVFKAMLGESAAKAGMREAERREIEIPDIKVEVLKSFVRYLYTDTCPSLASHAAEMLQAADKYNVPSLKRECEESLAASLRAANAAELALLAHLHSAEHLLRAALDFVAGHIQAVRRTSGFRTLQESGHRDLLSRLIGAWAFSSTP